MVDTGILAGLALLGFLCFAIPIGGFVFLSVKKKHVAKPFFIGMLVFLIFQSIIRMTLLSFIRQTEWFIAMADFPWLYGLFMGGTAAIAEEFGRYTAVRYWLKENRRYVDGIAFGLGHGGFEAMFIIGLNSIGNLFVLLSGSSYMSALIVTQLSYTVIFIALLERIFAITAQVGLSMLVFYSVRTKKLRYLVCALLIHTVIDASVVILPGVFGLSVYWIEGAVFLAAAGLMIWTVKIRSKFDQEEAPL